MLDGSSGAQHLYQVEYIALREAHHAWYGIMSSIQSSISLSDLRARQVNIAQVMRAWPNHRTRMKLICPRVHSSAPPPGQRRSGEHYSH